MLTPNFYPSGTHGDKERKRRKTIKMKEVIEVLQDYGRDPIEEVVKILVEGELKEEIAVRAWLELANYVHPKKKAMEITGEGGGALQVNATVKFIRPSEH